MFFFIVECNDSTVQNEKSILSNNNQVFDTKQIFLIDSNDIEFVEFKNDSLILTANGSFDNLMALDSSELCYVLKSFSQNKKEEPNSHYIYLTRGETKLSIQKVSNYIVTLESQGKDTLEFLNNLILGSSIHKILRLKKKYNHLEKINYVNFGVPFGAEIGIELYFTDTILTKVNISYWPD
jgi:hypothetical protein